jgi:hypothetical protein
VRIAAQQGTMHFLLSNAKFLTKQKSIGIDGTYDSKDNAYLAHFGYSIRVDYRRVLFYGGWKQVSR